MSNISCCKDCEFRVIGCHAICESYLKEKEQHDANREKIRKMKDITSLVDGFAIDSNRRMKNRRRRGKKV